MALCSAITTVPCAALTPVAPLAGLARVKAGFGGVHRFDVKGTLTVDPPAEIAIVACPEAIGTILTLEPLTLSDAINGLSARAVTAPVAFMTLTVTGAAGTPITTLVGETERACGGVVPDEPDDPPHAEQAISSEIATVLAVFTVQTAYMPGMARIIQVAAPPGFGINSVF